MSDENGVKSLKDVVEEDVVIIDNDYLDNAEDGEVIAEYKLVRIGKIKNAKPNIIWQSPL